MEAFKDLKTDVKGRRRLVSTLVREAYLSRPLPMAGQVVEELEKADFFRLRGVLVGTVAYQCYSAGLGRRLDAAAMQTGDADFAQFQEISAAVGDSFFMEAWDRGDHWSAAIRTSLATYDDDFQKSLSVELAKGVTELGSDSADYDPRSRA